MGGLHIISGVGKVLCMDGPVWLPAATDALTRAECLMFHAGAGLGVDSGLPDFRGPQGFWRAYPPMERLGLSLADVSCPRSFERDPAFGWGFFGHRYQLYCAATPHDGYHIMRRWGQAAALGHAVFTSNVDGHFLRAGFDEERVVERHGSIHFLQAFDDSLCADVWPAADSMAELRVDPVTFIAAGPLPACPGGMGAAAGTLARPNILMFGDWGWVSGRTDDQLDRHARFLDSIPRRSRVVVVEVGAGSAVTTVRHQSAAMLLRFPNAVLLRINPSEPGGGPRTVPIPMGGKEALEMLDACVGAAGIGSAAEFNET